MRRVENLAKTKAESETKKQVEEKNLAHIFEVTRLENTKKHSSYCF